MEAEPPSRSCCASPMCTRTVTLATKSCHHHTLRHCPGAWWSYFTSNRGSQSRHRTACVPPNTNMITTTPTAGWWVEQEDEELVWTALAFGYWCVCASQKIKTEMRCNHSTADLQKQPSFPTTCCLLIKTRVYLCRHTAQTPVLQLLHGAHSGWGSGH